MRKPQHGFTLIELMIVVAIIGIMAAIAIPTFISFKKKALLGVAAENLGRARTALALYAADQDDWCYPVAIANYNVFVTMMDPYGMKLPPNRPQAIKWDPGAAWEYVQNDCVSFTLKVAAADGETVFKATTIGVCCSNDSNPPSNCTNYARNVSACSTFGIE